MKKILITGSSGFVGSAFLSFFKLNTSKLLLPTHEKLNLNSRVSVFSYFEENRPDYMVNFAAINRIEDSEKERNNKGGRTWQTNVEGTKNLVMACKKFQTFLVQISTDAIFPGTNEYPGPYSENNRPAENLEEINWYGVTKLKAEEIVNKSKIDHAIVRISHPFGNLKSERDLIRKSLNIIITNRSSFIDQFFTPTYSKDLALAIGRIIAENQIGIFHVACKNPTYRIELDRFVAQKIGIYTRLKEGSIKEFSKNGTPRSIIGGLKVEGTEKELKVQFHDWKDAIDELDFNYLKLLLKPVI